jgi:hypothetical protein
MTGIPCLGKKSLARVKNMVHSPQALLPKHGTPAGYMRWKEKNEMGFRIPTES